MSPTVRPPAVAGLFYEADPAALRRTVEGYVGAAPAPRLPTGRFRAVLLPHAGHVYSGRIAGLGVGAVEWPEAVILLGPNHTGRGAAASVSPASAWETPLGAVPVDARLRDDLLVSCRRLALDEAAHRQEHSLEVILPFLQAVRPDVRIVCVSMGDPDLSLCRDVGEAVAGAVSRSAEEGVRVAIVVSSDLNHYLPRAQNRKKDDRALDALLAGDPDELFDRVLVKEGISMCGILPATALLVALRRLGGARAELLAHGDSSDAGGGASRVVGYASVLWSLPEAA